MPMAVRGTNFVLAHRNLWLAWQGGKQPYMVSLKPASRKFCWQRHPRNERDLRARLRKTSRCLSGFR